VSDAEVELDEAKFPDEGLQTVSFVLLGEMASIIHSNSRASMLSTQSRGSLPASSISIRSFRNWSKGESSVSVPSLEEKAGRAVSAGVVFSKFMKLQSISSNEAPLQMPGTSWGASILSRA
jgi:hypothetical protein